MRKKNNDVIYVAYSNIRSAIALFFFFILIPFFIRDLNTFYYSIVAFILFGLILFGGVRRFSFHKNFLSIGIPFRKSKIVAFEDIQQVEFRYKGLPREYPSMIISYNNLKYFKISRICEYKKIIELIPLIVLLKNNEVNIIFNIIDKDSIREFV